MPRTPIAVIPTNLSPYLRKRNPGPGWMQQVQNAIQTVEASVVDAPELPEPTLTGQILYAVRPAAQDPLKYWRDGASLRPLQAQEAAGGMAFWFDGGVFDGIAASLALAWQVLNPGPEGAVLTMVGSVPTWGLPAAAAPATPVPTDEQPDPAPVAPPAAVEKAQFRATATGTHRLAMSGSAAIWFPALVTDTQGFRGASFNPPASTDVSILAAVRIPAAGIYSLQAFVAVSDPDDDPAMTLSIRFVRTTEAGVQTTLIASEAISIEDEGGTGILLNFTGTFAEGEYVDVRYGGSNAGYSGGPLSTSFFAVQAA